MGYIVKRLQWCWFRGAEFRRWEFQEPKDWPKAWTRMLRWANPKERYIFVSSTSDGYYGFLLWNALFQIQYEICLWNTCILNNNYFNFNDFPQDSHLWFFLWTTVLIWIINAIWFLECFCTNITLHTIVCPPAYYTLI